MFYFALRRIQNGSESAIENLKTRLKKMKISKIPGENVEEAISFIKSAYQVLVSASSETRNYIPDDLPKTILKIFQTTSVKAFNDDFKLEYQMAQTEADKVNGVPEYPSIAELMTMAGNKYRRLVADDHWHVPKKSATAFPAVDQQFKGPNAKKPRLSSRRCFGCGSPDHMLQDCNKRGSEEEIAKRRQAFRDEIKATRSKQGNTAELSANQATNKPNKKGRDAKGRPMKLNKKNVYVVDQKMLRMEEDVKTLTQAYSALSSGNGNGSKSDDDQNQIRSETPTEDDHANRPAPGVFAAQIEQGARALQRLTDLIPSAKRG